MVKQLLIKQTLGELPIPY